MADGTTKFEQYSEWLEDRSDVAAIIMRQWLEPVEGKDAVIFPPTYVKPERGQDDWLGYNVDTLADGTKICQIDSVGAQANRMEPIFMRAEYKHLVPQVVVTAGDYEVNLLEAGHRAADAIVRFSALAEELERAFLDVRKGDATTLAKIAPTSFVFGAWDSRGTQVKLPRIVRSVIRAFDVQVLHRSAQYVPAIDYVEAGVIDAPEGKPQQDAMSELGLRHAPAPWTHGGVLAAGGVRRDAALNLAALRMLAAGPGRDPLPLRRYVLGLALVAFTAPQDTVLREGCQLIPDPERPAQWALVRHDGRRDTKFELTHDAALAFATAAAREFGVGDDRRVQFDAAAANAASKQSKDDRKKSRRARKGGGAEAEA
ncbi:MAG: type I-U CRISPR-associated protein Cas7 [Gemmatimonadaceae bacterium]|nr:type I-U CRISPR-associated protein Cas7 [Gemmatimonadaceae bacterium]